MDNKTIAIWSVLIIILGGTASYWALTGEVIKCKDSTGSYGWEPLGEIFNLNEELSAAGMYHCEILNRTEMCGRLSGGIGSYCYEMELIREELVNNTAYRNTMAVQLTDLTEDILINGYIDFKIDSVENFTSEDLGILVYDPLFFDSDIQVVGYSIKEYYNKTMRYPIYEENCSNVSYYDEMLEENSTYEICDKTISEQNYINETNHTVFYNGTKIIGYNLFNETKYRLIPFENQSVNHAEIRFHLKRDKAKLGSYMDDIIPIVLSEFFPEFVFINSNWTYFKEINATNLVNETIEIAIWNMTTDTETLISEGKMRSDCGDIRIVSENDNFEHDFTLEKTTCNSNETLIWIYSTLPALDITTVKMYYGNPDATTVSGRLQVNSLIQDFSGNDFDSTPVNNPGRVDGLNGKAVNLTKSPHRYIDSDSDYEGLQINGSLTFVGMVKTRALTNGVNVISGISGSGETPDNNGLWQIRIDNDGKVGFFHEYGNGVNAIIQAGTINLVNIDEWQCLAVTRNNSAKEYRVFINGTYQQTNTYDENPEKNATGNTQTYVYGHPTSTASYDGLIDDAVTYDSILSDSEISNICDDMFAGNEINITNDLQLYNTFDDNWDGLNNDDELVAYYHMDTGVTTDFSGNNYYGLPRNNPTIVDGLNNKALNLSDDLISNIIYNESYEGLQINGSISFITMIKTRSLDDSQNILAPITAIGETLETNTLFNFRISNTGIVTANHEFGAGDNAVINASTVSTVNIDEWQCLALVRNNSAKTYETYLNGTSMETVSYDENPEKASSGNIQQLVFGQFGQTTSTYDGLVNEVVIYNKTLSDTEISSVCDNMFDGAVNNNSEDRQLYHTFDQDNFDLEDYSGNGNNGVINGANFTTNCIFGPCYDFDGVDDYIIDSSPTGLPSGNISKSMGTWFKSDNLADVYHTLGGFGTNVNGQNFQIQTHQNTNNWTINGWGGAFGWNTGVSVLSYENDAWHYIIVTYDGNKTILYINGVNLSETTSFSWNTNPVKIIIGLQIDETTRPFDGLIDEFRIYNRTLSANEILQIYNSTNIIVGDESDGRTHIWINPASNTTVLINTTLFNTSYTNEFGHSINNCIFEFNGTNETANISSGSTGCFINKSYPIGNFDYRMFANDTTGVITPTPIQNLIFSELIIENIITTPGVNQIRVNCTFTDDPISFNFSINGTGETGTSSTCDYIFRDLDEDTFYSINVTISDGVTDTTENINETTLQGSLRDWIWQGTADLKNKYNIISGNSAEFIVGIFDLIILRTQPNLPGNPENNTLICLDSGCQIYNGTDWNNIL